MAGLSTAAAGPIFRPSSLISRPPSAPGWRGAKSTSWPTAWMLPCRRPVPGPERKRRSRWLGTLVPATNMLEINWTYGTAKVLLTLNEPAQALPGGSLRVTRAEIPCSKCSRTMVPGAASRAAKRRSRKPLAARHSLVSLKLMTKRNKLVKARDRAADWLVSQVESSLTEPSPLAFYFAKLWCYSFIHDRHRGCAVELPTPCRNQVKRTWRRILPSPESLNQTSKIRIQVSPCLKVLRSRLSQFDNISFVWPSSAPLRRGAAIRPVHRAAVVPNFPIIDRAQSCRRKVDRQMKSNCRFASTNCSPPATHIAHAHQCTPTTGIATYERHA